MEGGEKVISKLRVSADDASLRNSNGRVENYQNCPQSVE